MCRLCGLIVLALALALVSEVGGQVGGKSDTKKKKLPPVLEEVLRGGPDAFIKQFDKNKDGMITKDELPPYLHRAFERFDSNGDGKLDRPEVVDLVEGLRNFFGLQPKAQPKGQPKGPASEQVEALVNKLLALQDTNKDGKISRAEARGQLANNFDQFDTNKDGFLDRMELRAVAQRVIANQKGGLFKGGPFKKGPAFDFDAYDKNADGRLTRDEVRGTPLEKLFDQIDTNRDGRISRDEFEEFLEKGLPKKK
jgi:Ca2+-binding EF-hand superfamily protein